MLRIRLLIVVVVGLALLASACGEVDDDLAGADEDEDVGQVDEDEDADDGVDEDEGTEEETEEAPPASEPRLRIGATLEPPTLDLLRNASAAIPEILLYNVVESLVRVDQAGEIQPLLAESWDVSDDGRVYTFNLVEAEWHDGTRFSADDVLYTFELGMDEDFGHVGAQYFRQVEAIEAPDDRTVEVTLEQPSNNWLFFMGGKFGTIVSEATLDSLAEAPVGTGPFRFDRWVRGDRIELAANEDFREGPPALEQVVMTYIEDPSALNNALLAGDIDVIARVAAPELLQAFEDDDRFEILEGDSTGQVQLTLNNQAPPLDDVNVRRALTHAIDRQGLVNAAYAGYGEVIGTHASPVEPWYVDLAGEYPYDPDRARELLAEAGHPDGFQLNLKLPPPPYARRSGEVIAGQLAEVGIDVDIENIEFGTWVETVFGDADFEATIIAHVAPRDIWTYGNPDQYWGYDNAEVQEWLRDADAAPDESDRDELYARVQHQITEDAVNVWLFLLPELVVTRAGVNDYEPTRVFDSIRLQEVTFTP